MFLWHQLRKKKLNMYAKSSFRCASTSMNLVGISINRTRVQLSNKRNRFEVILK